MSKIIIGDFHLIVYQEILEAQIKVFEQLIKNGGNWIPTQDKSEKGMALYGALNLMKRVHAQCQGKKAEMISNDPVSYKEETAEEKKIRKSKEVQKKLEDMDISNRPRTEVVDDNDLAEIQAVLEDEEDEEKE